MGELKYRGFSNQLSAFYCVYITNTTIFTTVIKDEPKDRVGEVFIPRQLADVNEELLLVHQIQSLGKGQ